MLFLAKNYTILYYNQYKLVLVMEIDIEKGTKKQEFSQQIQENKQIKTSGYIPGQKNGKWSQEQHMKYIAFIDFYKEKMRSKEKRRSNQFYKQMSDFISSRNGLQCRSHHQKLQQKYIYTNKIIAAFKENFDIQMYKQYLIMLKKSKIDRIGSFQGKISDDSPSMQMKLTKNVQVQTDLQGVGFNYILADSNTIMIYPPMPSICFDNRSLFYPQNFFFTSN